MNNSIVFLIVSTLSGLTVTSAEAVQVFNDDIAISNATPAIILDDTDESGDEWYIRGRNEFFSIVDADVTEAAVLYVNPVQQSTALGYNANAAGLNSAALGFFAEAAEDYSTAVGYYALTMGIDSSALGYLAFAGGDGSTALGREASATGADSAALGRFAVASGIDSTALGRAAKAFGDYSTALGVRAQADQAWSVVLGAIKGVNLAPEYANVGIGTKAPIQAVDVERSGEAARFQLTSFTDTANEAPQFIQRRARGTTSSPSTVLNNDNLGLFSFRGYNGTVMGGSRATITAQAAGNFTNSSTPTRLIFATTPVGQTTPQQVLVITPDGKVQVNGQNLDVPDYVFEDDYELLPLDELRAFISANGHLPGVASAEEVKAGTLDLVEAPLRNLRKIEELTLYTLQQQSELDTVRQLERENRELGQRVAQLEQLVQSLLPMAAQN